MLRSPAVRLWLLLLGLNMLAIAAVFPYLLALQGDVLATLPVSVPVLFVLQLAQGAVTFGIVIALGLRLARKTGLRLPLLEAVAAGRPVPFTGRDIALSAFKGAVAALAIIAADLLFRAAGAGLEADIVHIPLWQRALAPLYGGIAEETLMRLFLVSLLVWIGSWLTGMRGKPPRPPVFTAAILLAAVLFGLGHLPVTAALTDITPLIVLRAIVLNGIGGTLFGWLYWRHGLEAAMVAHASADVVLVVVVPAVTGTL